MERIPANCKCYVHNLDALSQFCLRWGAHNPACTLYRPSLDPVDRQEDEEYRARMDPKAVSR